jgi:flagellar motor switch protein FliG
MRQLPAEELEAVSQEIAANPVVPHDVIDAVLNEFKDVARAAESVANGGIAYARQILEQALGSQRAKGVLERIQEQMVDTGLKGLKKAAPDVLLSVLRGEHPQTVALILAHLPVPQAAAVIEVMGPELASEVLYRVARMEEVSPEMLQLVESGLASKADLSLSQEMTISGGPAAVANVLNLATGSLEKSVLEAIGQKNTELADAIKNLMFVFEDLKTVDGKSMQRLLRDVDGKDLALALKAASEELKQHVFNNMSERGAAALREEIEYLGSVRVKDVEAAQARMIASARALEEQGEVVLAHGKGDDVIR